MKVSSLSVLTLVCFGVDFGLFAPALSFDAHLRRSKWSGLRHVTSSPASTTVVLSISANDREMERYHENLQREEEDNHRATFPVEATLSDVLAEARKAIRRHEQAPQDGPSPLMLAPSKQTQTEGANDLSSPDLMEENWRKILQLATDLKQQSEGLEDPLEALPPELREEYVASSAALALLGVTVGSPLVVGAALGYAGTHFLQGKSAGPVLEFWEETRSGIRGKLKEFVDAVSAQLEDDEEITVLPGKLWAMAQARAEKDVKLVQQTDVDDLMETIRSTLASEEHERTTTSRKSPARISLLFDSQERMKHVSEQHIKLREALVKDFQNRFGADINFDLDFHVDMDSIKSMKGRAQEALQEVAERRRRRIEKVRSEYSSRKRDQNENQPTP